MRPFRRTQPQCFYPQFQSQLGCVTPGYAYVVAVCVFMLTMAVVADEHVHLASTEPVILFGRWCVHPHHHFKPSPLMLPLLNNILPAMALQSVEVKSNIWYLSHSSSHASVYPVSSSPGFSVPSGPRRMVVGAVVVLLLLMSGDIEMNPGPVVKNLNLDDLGCVLEELVDISTQWYNLGLQLSIRIGQLDNISEQFPAPLTRLREMLKVWLANFDNTSWKTLTSALKSKSVGATQLADALETKYCLAEETDTDTAIVTSDSQPPTNITSPLPVSLPTLTAVSKQAEMQESTCTSSSTSPKTSLISKAVMQYSPTPEASRISKENGEEAYCNSVCNDECTHLSKHSSGTNPPTSKEQPPFGCGCGKCTFFSFLESGCPEPISSASSFPYLDVSRLTDEHQQTLKGRLYSESQQIIIAFQKLVSVTRRSLEEQHIPLSDIVSDIMTLGAFDSVYKGQQVPALHQYLENLQTAHRVSDIFLILRHNLSFFNYHIIEHIIEVLGTKKDKENLQNYKKQFNQYAKRRIFECPPQFGPVSETDHADLIVKLDSQYDKYTVTELEKFRCQLSKTFHVSPKGVLRLCQVKVGCMQLTFQVPLFVRQKIFPLSTEQNRTLQDNGVIRLTCGEYNFIPEEKRRHVLCEDEKSEMEEATQELAVVGVQSKIPLAKDLLNPSQEEEKRRHKLKKLVQSPNSYFMDVKCPGCNKITIVFSHAQTVVLCVYCSIVLCQPTGGKARLTEGCSFRRKQ